jgi:hypothetical protein
MEVSMSRDEVQGQVRRRDRFQCQNCGQKGQQYAHIVPDSDGGDYILENLIFLCYDCHNLWQEPARTSSGMKATLIALSQQLRDQAKRDNLLSSIFSWPAGQISVVTFGGGMRIVGQERILERIDDPTRPYLTLVIDDLGRLHINAYFDDAQGNDFMHVTDNILRVHTADAWDIIFNRRSIRFEHADRTMMLQIKQADNLDLQISGNLYLNGGYYEITDAHIRDIVFNNIVRGCGMEGNGHGLLLSPRGIAF